MKQTKYIVFITVVTLLITSGFGSADSRRGKFQHAGDPVAKPNVRKPHIVVESFAYMPAPLKAGANVDTSIIFKNKGLASSHKDAKFRITCTVLSGGGPNQTCPVPVGDKKLGKAIPPNKTHTYTSLGATPALAGKYKITVSFPGQSSRGRPFSLTINVAPKYKLQKSGTPAVKKR